MRALFISLAIFSIILTDVLGHIPGCDYFDTVDLTNSQKFENGSYQYENILVPKEDLGEYDYQILFNGEVESVPKHTRGCVCKKKTCIRFCCDPQKLLVHGERKCESADKNLDYSMVINITLDNGTQIEKNVMDFTIQQHLPVPCNDHFFLDEMDENHKWSLFENGTLRRHFDDRELSKSDYCLQPHNLDQNIYKLVPHHCLDPPEYTNSYIQMVSVFFMILIIFVYLILPNFKGVHGKCCTCYFVCLTLSFILRITVSFELVQITQSLVCPLVGYTGYYIIIATFLWLLIINYNLWKTFNNIGVNRKSRFFYYNIFVWSVAAFLLTITGLVDLIGKGSSALAIWIPAIGVSECWINLYYWSAMIYFYGPILLLLIFNLTLFIKTAVRIFAQNRKNRRQLKKSESQRNLRNLTNFSMFVRLFAIMGVIWILEIVSYIWSLIDLASSGLTFADALTSGQGVLLFAVTILKRDVLISLADRILKRKSQNDASISTTSQLPLTEISLMSRAPRTSKDATDKRDSSH